MNPAPVSAPTRPRSRATLLWGLAGSLLCYLAQPPVAWGWLAWLGPAPWIVLASLVRLPGRRPYGALWLAGVVHWLVTIQWLRLAHPVNHVAWVLVSIYLGGYLPVFVGLTRVASRRIRVPIWVAAPVVWTGLEWARAHLLTGFLMASLAHTQIQFPAVLQLASVAGEYGVTFLIVAIAACIAEAIPVDRDSLDESAILRWTTSIRLEKLVPGIAIGTLAIGFGMMRLLNASLAGDDSDPIRVAIVQSDMLSDWKGNEQRDQAVMQQQTDLSLDAARRAGLDPIDVVIWPETMFRLTLFTLDESLGVGRQLPDQPEFQAAPRRLAELTSQFNAALLVGIDRVNILPAADPTPGSPNELEVYNSSVFVTPAGEISGTYDKMHLLPFGEYIPLAKWLPLVGRLTPITGSATPGKGPAAFAWRNVIFSPSICYETVLPHLIRRHTTELCARQQRPDVLVNLTNDAWYWGSAELDMHLASGVLRAVEMRTALVIAANRGLSAHIDAFGRIEQVSQRDQADALIADVHIPRPSNRTAVPTAYAQFGDWLPLTCLACCAAIAVVGLRTRRQL